MTRINPRANEVAAVVELMEHGYYETPEQLARAIVVAVASELSHRTTIGVAARFPGETASMAVGPFFHKDDVSSFIEKAQECGLWARTARLSSPDSIRDQDAVEAGFCECDHQKEQHVVKVKKDVAGKPQECGITECDCRNFTPRRKAA
jgi:hypothetical protein